MKLRDEPMSPRNRDVHVYRRQFFIAGAAKAAIVRVYRWVVAHRGLTLPNSYTQREAIQLGRAWAKDLECDLVIHGADGRIRRKDSYGRDSRRRRG